MLIRDLFYAFGTLPQEPDIHHHGGGPTIALAYRRQTLPIFSVTNGVLLRPLPYKDPERLGLDL